MKRFIVLIVAALMVFQTGVAFADTSRFEVTEPITIEWWHAHEHQWIPTMEYMVEQFEAQHPHIRVEPVYIGSYAEVNTKFIAAVASGDVPALVSVKTNYLSRS